MSDNNKALLEAIGQREKTSKSAHFVSSSQPYFKILAGVGLAGLTMGSGGSFPFMVAAGMGVGAMLGNVAKKTFNHHENTPEKNALILAAMDIPVVQATVHAVFRSDELQKRSDDILKGDTDQYEALSGEFLEATKKYKLFGVICCGMLFSQSGIDDPREIFEAMKNLAETSEDGGLFSEMKEFNDEVKSYIAEIENSPEFKALTQAIEEHDPSTDFSWDNVVEGMNLEDSKLLKKYEELKPNLDKLNEFIKQSAKANETVQDVMGSTKNGKPTFSAFTKNEKIAQKIVFIESIVHRIFDFPDKLKAQILLDLIDKAHYLKQQKMNDENNKSPQV